MPIIDARKIGKSEMQECTYFLPSLSSFLSLCPLVQSLHLLGQLSTFHIPNWPNLSIHASFILWFLCLLLSRKQIPLLSLSLSLSDSFALGPLIYRVNIVASCFSFSSLFSFFTPPFLITGGPSKFTPNYGAQHSANGWSSIVHVEKR